MSEVPSSEGKRAAARARGDVAVSPLACAAGAFAGAALAIESSDAGARLIELATRAFTSGSADPVQALRAAWATATALLVPLLAGAVLGALVLGLAQTRAVFALRAVGARPLVAPPRAVAWMLAAALALLAVGSARSLLPSLARAHGLAAVWSVARTATLLRVLFLFAAAGLGDWVWRRLRLERALRMTRAEVEAERRDEQADPRLAAELRRRREVAPRRPQS